MRDEKKSPFTEMLESAFGNYLKDSLRTSVPGHILEFDPATQLAQVQIGVLRIGADGESFAPSPIVEVPVQFPGAAGGAVEFKIVAGDEGYILFAQRCIDAWVNQGGVAPTPDLRRFSENDAYFVPGLRSQPNVLVGFQNNGIRLRNKAGTRYLWIKDDGDIDILAANINVTGVATFQNNVITNADILNQGKSIGIGHGHSGVQSGGSNTGGVV